MPSIARVSVCWILLVNTHPCGGGLECLNLAPRVVGGDEKGTQYPGVQLGHPVPGGDKYGDLALQVGGVSNETVKYGREFCGTWTRERLHWQGPEAIK
jgi:hypothetical protein